LKAVALAAENELLRGQLVQERVFIRAMADDVAGPLTTRAGKDGP
jgi:hypothetical protein